MLEAGPLQSGAVWSPLPPPTHTQMLLCQAAVCHSQADGESRLFPISAIGSCRIRIVPSSAVGGWMRSRGRRPGPGLAKTGAQTRPLETCHFVGNATMPATVGAEGRGPPPGWFLRRLEKGRNQVRLFLRPNQCINTKEDMCPISPPLRRRPPQSIRLAWLGTSSQ